MLWPNLCQIHVGYFSRIWVFNILKMFKAMNFCVKKSVSLNSVTFFQRTATITSGIKTPDIKPTETKSPQQITAVKYKPLYHFPPIRLISAVGRIKWMQLGVTILAIPLCTTIASMGYIPSGIEYAVGFAGNNKFNSFIVVFNLHINKLY